MDELEAGEEPLGRVRRPGGGRKKVADLDPGLRRALLALVEPDERGDPMSPLRWTVKSTRTLAAELTRQGHKVSADTVGDLLREEDFSLQAGANTIEGKQHPYRDAQFRYINEQSILRVFSETAMDGTPPEGLSPVEGARGAASLDGPAKSSFALSRTTANSPPRSRQLQPSNDEGPGR